MTDAHTEEARPTGEEEVRPLEELDEIKVDASSDAWLVRECLNGNQEAWAALIQKYKRLIYSIPFKYGAAPDDSADIFQAVCLELFSELGNLRKVESLRSWIITVTVHKAFHWKKSQRPQDVEIDGMETDSQEPVQPGDTIPEVLVDLEQQQIVREAILKLPKRCAEMVRLLFYEHPPLPYAEVAQRLGLATGSIGFIRGRCLTKLQKILTEMGF
jgi:RNA polymerase sigma factor (sigma-70 family)